MPLCAAAAETQQALLLLLMVFGVSFVLQFGPWLCAFGTALPLQLQGV
jgi:hypothetical protein